MGDEIIAAEPADAQYVGIKLDQSAVQELDRIAAETYRSRAGIIRLAINRLIEAEKANVVGEGAK